MTKDDYEMRVTVDERADRWDWSVGYVGDFVCAGQAVSVASALRRARSAARKEGYEFDRLRLVRETDDADGLRHKVFGANTSS